MHLTDDQLNEYLDNESTERVLIETHLSSCGECAARLFALQSLFAEIESLPELEFTHSIAARFAQRPSLPPQLPRWLTLTATLQVSIAIIVLFVAAPLVSTLLPAFETPSFTAILLQLQLQWTMFLYTFTNYQLPTLPPLPPLEISSLMLSFTLVGVSLLWLVGNGLLLRKQIRYTRRPNHE